MEEYLRALQQMYTDVTAMHQKAVAEEPQAIAHNLAMVMHSIERVILMIQKRMDGPEMHRGTV